VNPLEYGEEIKRLFLAHERPEFPAFFDRTYPDAVADGASSWVGRDAEGRICAHIAQFPRPFRFGHSEVRGSLLANLMVAKAHRSVWPALGLVRNLLGDSKKSGTVDFLYGDPNEKALAILKAVGFRDVGALRRFVLPLTDRRRSVDLGIRLYHLLGRVKAQTTSLVATAQRAGEIPAGSEPLIDAAADVDSLRPGARPSVFRHRLADYPSTNDWWYTFRRRGAAGGPVGAALVRGPDNRGLSVVCALQFESLALVSSVLVSLAGALRETGAERLEVSVMAGSQVASEVRRVGFVPREDCIPVVAMPLSPLGTQAIGVGAEWRVLPVDLDR
jgi:hypothetical protein